MAALLALLATALVFGSNAFKIGTPQDDLVKDIPGLLFNVTFNTYSGYLDAGTYENKSAFMHYMLAESKNDPTTDPVILWLQGGPGCSGFSGAFEELGPFYVNKDGETLYENIYAWNKNASTLFFESPIGVGYSFLDGVPNYSKAYDNQTLLQNYNALNSFFNKFPSYKNRNFFISGESYGGIYLPMLGAKLMEGIISKDFVNPNFQGIAIGNGYMDIVALQNALVLWSNYHGRVSLQDWETLKSKDCCGDKAGIEFDDCDFFSNAFESENWLDFTPKNNSCGQILENVIIPPPSMDQYNYYEDCYARNDQFVFKGTKGRFHKGKRDSLLAAKRRYHNTASVIDYNATDFQFGYPCWQATAVGAYFDRPEVQKAFHVDVANLTTFHDCNDPIYEQYNVTYRTTKQFFDYMLNIVQKANLANFRILVYNGDVDTVCNYLGDAKFIDNVHKSAGLTENPRKPWIFSNTLAGFAQHYNGSLSIDVLTVKGAGHMVPMDRPGPSLQMINAFMSGEGNYSDPNPKPKPQSSNKPGSGSSIQVSFFTIAFALLLSSLFL